MEMISRLSPTTGLCLWPEAAVPCHWSWFYQEALVCFPSQKAEAALIQNWHAAPQLLRAWPRLTLSPPEFHFPCFLVMAAAWQV
jgi:hypothetical protein